jgi:hypothetical protein
MSFIVMIINGKRKEEERAIVEMSFICIGST